MFIDELTLSELNDKSNIKEIRLLDSNNNSLTISKWDFRLHGDYEDYTTRYLSITAAIEDEKTKLETLELEFIDGVKEKFDTGDLLITSENYNKFTLPSNTEMIPAMMGKGHLYRITGIILQIPISEAEEIIIQDIDLGLEGFEADYNNIHLEYGNVFDVLDMINRIRTVNPSLEWLKPFDELVVNPQYVPDNTSTQLEIDTDWIPKKSSTFFAFIPIICTDNKVLGMVNAFHPSAKAIIDGETYEIQAFFSMINIPKSDNEIFHKILKEIKR